MKVGKVAIVGRPNAGKSTLINALVGRKISIVSPSPQTTRKTVRGVYWDEKGQIIFSDTPGILAKIKDPVSSQIPTYLKKQLSEADLVLYLIDRTRQRGEEENRILGLVRLVDKPKIIVINKIDVKRPNQIHEYKFLEDEFDDWVEISATKPQHLKTLIEKIFEHLPEGEPLFDPEKFQTFPAMDISPKDFVAEIIREKVFLVLRQELPYTIGIKVEGLEETENMFKIRAEIHTTEERYKPMIIGKQAKVIKEIGTLARKEIELITNKKVFLDLQVVVNPHWYQEILN